MLDTSVTTSSGATGSVAPAGMVGSFGASGASGSFPIFAGSSGSWSSGSSADPSGSGFDHSARTVEGRRVELGLLEELGGTAGRRASPPP